MEVVLVDIENYPIHGNNITIIIEGPDKSDVSNVENWISKSFCQKADDIILSRAKLARVNDAVSQRFGKIGGRWFVSEADLSDTLPYAEAINLLDARRGEGRVAILAGSELCALTAFWKDVASRAGSDFAAILIVSSAPVEAAPAELLHWFNLLLAAERSTRHLQRRIVHADSFEDVGKWIVSTLGLLPVRALPDHTGEANRSPIPAVVPLGYNSWMRRCEAALAQLVNHGENEASHRELDNIGASLDAALAIFSPLLNKSQIEVDKLRADNMQLLLAHEDRENKFTELENSRQALSLELEPLRQAVSTHQAETAIQRDVHAEVKAQADDQLLDAHVKLTKSVIANRRLEDALAMRIERQVSIAGRPIARWWRPRGLSRKAARQIESHAAIIEGFLDQLPWTTVGLHPDGRRRRIYAYLAGAIDALPDFPLVQNVEYTEMYPDVLSSGMTPLIHFILHGQGEMRNPHPLFDTLYYTSQCPEAKHLAPSPVIHYLKWGFSKGYDPHPLFSAIDYSARYPSVVAEGLNPLLHSIQNILCIANALFDPVFYMTAYPDIAEAGRNPLTHYLSTGWYEGRNPNPWFDTKYYLANNPTLARNGVNPLIHYAHHGWRENQAPGPAFDPVYYRANAPGLPDDCEPLRYYIEHGRRQGHRTAPDVLDSSPLATLRPAKRPEAVGKDEITARARLSGSTVQPVVLMIDAFYPRPDQDSGSLDHINFARIFQRMGYEVHYLSLMEFEGDYDARSAHYRGELEALRVHCVTREHHTFVEGYYFEESDRIDICFVSRAHFGGQQVEILRQLCPEAKIIFNTVDLHFVREEREGTLKNEPSLIRRSLQTRDLELGLAATVDATIVVSSSEKELLDELCPQANSVVIPLIREFGMQGERTFAERKGLAFVGGYDHQPNVDAVEYFLEDIWPLVHERRPDIIFYVIGSKMPDEWSKRKIPGVTFTGFVEDLDAELASLRLTVAPLRYGAGAKGKLVSSLAAGVPAVITSIAAEGMGLVDGGTVLVADEAERFAEAIIRLHEDEALWGMMSAEGAAFIRKHYSIEKGFDLMRNLLVGLGLHPPSGHN